MPPLVVSGTVAVFLPLGSVRFPSLVAVGGDLKFYELNSLSTLELPWLTSVNEDFYIAYNSTFSDLGNVSIDLVVGGRLVIEENYCLRQEDAENYAGNVLALVDVFVGGNTGPCE